MEPAPHVKDVLILDVTRMDLGRICMAGVSRDETQTLNNIRPVVPFKNLTREFLNQSGITPYSVVRFNFSKAVGVRPHVEDFAFDFQNPSSFVIIRKCGSKVVKPILEEIKYSFGLYQSQYEAMGGTPRRIEKIILTGGSSLLPRLPEFLTQQMSVNTYLGNPWARVVYPLDLRPTIEEMGPRYAVAIGCAMRDIE